MLVADYLRMPRMPRKLRIEYPGAVYHVISRGNYRKELFLSENTGKAFERTIFEAAERCGWKLHAYVIMSNHYHLAIGPKKGFNV
jgi:putative transposase